MATGITATNVATTRTTDNSGMVGDGEGELEVLADGELELELLGEALLLEEGDGEADELWVNTAW
jgi:hypothetical protein